jgi:hypothetical protein
MIPKKLLSGLQDLHPSVFIGMRLEYHVVCAKTYLVSASILINRATFITNFKRYLFVKYLINPSEVTTATCLHNNDGAALGESKTSVFSERRTCQETTMQDSE